MRMRTWAGALLLAALLAGCTAGRGTSPPPAPTAGVDEATPPGSSGEVTPAPAGGGAVADFPVKSGTDALRRVTYGSTLAIPGPGTYFVDLSTGKVETWQRPGAPASEWWVTLSADRRWVISEAGEQISWANRASGQVYSWNRKELQLVAAGPGQFLLVRPGSGAFTLTDANFQPQRTFTLELRQHSDLQAQFAPDGQSVAISTGRWPAPDGKPDTQVYLVDLATGAVRDLGALPTPASGVLVGAELLGPAGGGLLVSFVVQVMEPTGLAREETIVRRYSWQGERLGEFPVAGRAAQLSPDGRRLLAGQNLQYLTRAVLVTDVATGQPLFRVAGAGEAAWMAGGSGLVVQGEDGLQYLVSASGALAGAPHVPPGSPQVFDGRVQPAPGDAHRLLAGLAVVDETGKVLQRIGLPNREDWLIRGASWGAGDSEVVISISPPTGKGNIGFDLPLAPAVQKPPFAEPYLLTVRDPKGECLNLRESYTRESRVIRCLPTGTGLAVGDLRQAPEKLNGATYYNDGRLWLWARTEQGETGWVALDTGSVTWK